MRIKTYSVNKLLKLIIIQIDTNKTILHEKNSHTYVILEMITNDTIVSAKFKVRISIASTNSSNLNNSLIILYDAHIPYIFIILKEYLYLFLFNSNRYNDRYEFKNLNLYLECEKEHNK